MSESEKALDRVKLGNVKPTPELRESIEEAEKCKGLFDQCGFIDYLTSLNEFYFEDQGNIIGPHLQITDKFEINQDKEGDNNGKETLELSDISWGGIGAILEYINLGTNKKIHISFRYSNKNDYFSLYLSASTAENLGEQNSISRGRNITKSFYLNPNERMVKDVDNLLLTFTEELESGKFL